MKASGNFMELLLMFSGEIIGTVGIHDIALLFLINVVNTLVGTLA